VLKELLLWIPHNGAISCTKVRQALSIAKLSLQRVVQILVTFFLNIKFLMTDRKVFLASLGAFLLQGLLSAVTTIIIS